jgi:hypothetical protein
MMALADGTNPIVASMRPVNRHYSVIPAFCHRACTQIQRMPRTSAELGKIYKGDGLFTLTLIKDR